VTREARRWARAGLVPAVVAALLAAAPAGACLAALPTDDPGAVRVVLGEANATWARLDGEPTLDGKPAPSDPEPVPEDGLEPWRGYERTLRVDLGGSGRVLVTSGATGLVLEAPEGPGDANPGAGPSSGDSADRTRSPVDANDTGPAETAGGGAAREGTGTAPVETGPDDETGRRDGPEAAEHGASGLDRVLDDPVRTAVLAGAVVLAAAVPAWRYLRGDEGDEPLERDRSGPRRRGREDLGPYDRRDRGPARGDRPRAVDERRRGTGPRSRRGR
jgi:hypothetical protein